MLPGAVFHGLPQVWPLCILRHVATEGQVSQRPQAQRQRPKQKLCPGHDLIVSIHQGHAVSLPAKGAFQVSPCAELQRVGAGMRAYKGIPGCWVGCACLHGVVQMPDKR